MFEYAKLTLKHKWYVLQIFNKIYMRRFFNINNNLIYFVINYV